MCCASCWGPSQHTFLMESPQASQMNQTILLSAQADGRLFQCSAALCCVCRCPLKRRPGLILMTNAATLQSLLLSVVVIGPYALSEREKHGSGLSLTLNSKPRVGAQEAMCESHVCYSAPRYSATSLLFDTSDRHHGTAPGSPPPVGLEAVSRTVSGRFSLQPSTGN